MNQPRVERWVATSFVVFVGLGFIAPEPSWAAFFYVGVMPLGLWLSWGRWRPDWRDPRLMLFCALIVWSTLTLLWADEPRPPPSRQWLWVWNGLCTGTFFLCLTALAQQAETMRDRIGAVLVVCGAGNAALSIVMFLVRGGSGGRLEGWAETRNAILGASILGVCAIFALGRWVRHRGTHRGLVWAATVPLFLLFIVLTGSRGPLLALMVAVAVILPPRYLLAYLAGLLGTIVVVSIVMLLHPEWAALATSRLLERGTSYRLDIWRESLEEIARRPILGHGLTASLRIQGAFGHHPHNLYLSVAFYSGAIGLVMLGGGLIGTARDLFRLSPGPDRRLGLALLTHVVLSGVTDLSQITKGPGELWYIVWLPLGFLIGGMRDHSARDAPQTSARSSSRARTTVAERISLRSPGKIRRSV